MKVLKPVSEIFYSVLSLFFLLIIIITPTNVFAQNINITFNLTNTQKTLELLKKETISEQDLNDLLALESTKALIRKTETTDSLLVSAFIKSKKGVELTNQESLFQYDKIISELDFIEGFYSELITNSSLYQKELNASLGTYASPDQKIQVEVVGILGGNSTGYTFGDWDKFYITIHHMKGDSDYLLSIFKHELFHNLQAFRFDGKRIRNNLERIGDNPFNEYFNTYVLLEALYNEGTASYLDQWLEKEETEANESILERSKKSKHSKDYIFYLFDKLISSLVDESTEKDLNSIYSVFFTTRFNEAGYYMGSVMTEYILEKTGNNLTYYMDRGPVFLVSEYLEISSDDDQAPYVFSNEFYLQIQRLDTKIRSLD